MNPIAAIAVICLLLIVRMALPCAVIGGLCFGLDRLYERWDKEAELANVPAVPK